MRSPLHRYIPPPCEGTPSSGLCFDTPSPRRPWERPRCRTCAPGWWETPTGWTSPALHERIRPWVPSRTHHGHPFQEQTNKQHVSRAPQEKKKKTPWVRAKHSNSRQNDALTIHTTERYTKHTQREREKKKLWPCEYYHSCVWLVVSLRALL